MKCRTVTDNRGREFELTIAEEKVIRAIERLDKMDFGRIELFGSGQMSIRINGGWNENEIAGTNIKCDGGDGGD